VPSPRLKWTIRILVGLTLFHFLLVCIHREIVSYQAGPNPPKIAPPASDFVQWTLSPLFTLLGPNIPISLQDNVPFLIALITANSALVALATYLIGLLLWSGLEFLRNRRLNV
jgi:hypothetical protein